jgi:hypothetical protein
MRKFLLYMLILIPVCSLMGLAVYNLEPVQVRALPLLSQFQADVKYALNPPEQVVFVPQVTSLPPATALPSATPLPSATATQALPTPTGTPPPSPTPTDTPTPLPAKALLQGIVHEYQTWNNCGPANLAMALSFWGWGGDQRVTAEFLKPNPRDKNVMPYEMVSFVEEQTDLYVLGRVGGDLQQIKTFVSAGFPVVVEKGFEGDNFDGWMGHYEVVNGYDDEQGRFAVQDSYNGPTYVSYEDMEEQWRAFNFTYLVMYPANRQGEVYAILGPHVDVNFNDQFAAQKAGQEADTLEGRDQYFAMFNKGSNLVRLKDYAGAAAAFDAAFALYPSIPEEQRPWRMVWYQTGPYFAYYYTQRYQDVINLATTTLESMSEPVLEESYYWRAMAKSALGDTAGAVDDLRQALQVHPGFGPALLKLQEMGATP